MPRREPYPLQWPEGWPRTPYANRKPSRFFYGFADALRSLLEELRLIGAANVVITSDLPIRADGLPRAAGRGDVPDTGVAVWFTLNGQERVFPCDRWLTHAENIRAIALCVAAVRGIDRWGAGDVVNRAFQGFNALPAGEGSGPRPWAEVLGMEIPWPSTCEPSGRKLAIWERAKSAHAALMKAARATHHSRMREMHPDVGGDGDDARILNQQREAREAELDRALADAEQELHP